MKVEGEVVQLEMEAVVSVGEGWRGEEVLYRCCPSRLSTVVVAGTTVDTTGAGTSPQGYLTDQAR